MIADQFLHQEFREGRIGVMVVGLASQQGPAQHKGQQASEQGGSGRNGTAQDGIPIPFRGNLPPLGFQLVSLVTDLSLALLQIALQCRHFGPGLGFRFDEPSASFRNLILQLGHLLILFGLTLGRLAGHLNHPFTFALAANY
jgi:hypothetical protein